MLTPEQNELLTRVGPGTPMGAVFRSYWIPALLASELPEADGAPVRVRLLGEDLIAFRDTSGRTGLVSAFCPHRRAPMFFGRNEECGLRCVYHGWKFDRDGNCVDMPSEPPDSLFKTKVKIEAYPTWEGGGLIWTYMGPPAEQPGPPAFEFVRAPETHRFVSKNWQDSNYLQALEGGLDSVHATIMHNMNIGDRSFLADYERTVPQLSSSVTDYGFTYSGVRYVDDKQWVRAYHYVMPLTQIRGQISDAFSREIPLIAGHMWVPIDDTHNATYHFAYSADPARPITREYAESIERIVGRAPEDYESHDPYRLKKTMANDYLIDRHAQKYQSFTGISGANTQDVAVQECMGPIVDRSKEHLGTTDRAVIVLRQLLLEAVQTVNAGGRPRGADPESYRTVRALDHIIPRELVWQDALKTELLAKF